MKYNPKIHHRRSIRLKGYDYSQAGAYFITICTKDRECFFGRIEKDEMILSEYGKFSYDEWHKLSQRFSNFELDVFQIMPNHIHAIIVLNGPMARATTTAVGLPGLAGPNLTATLNDNDVNMGIGNNKMYVDSAVMQNDNGAITVGVGVGASPAPTVTNITVGDIVGAYKSLVANGCLNIFKLKYAGVDPAPSMGKLWQRNYYEHIITNEQSYQTISNYIINNPLNWKKDKFVTQ